ncbi:MAG TPA: hypothetical protein VHY79_15515 [Rhizomicrobium sp.]|jgi:hypothetical protein|nr:hypothetical protein [Rhizomicrobium sp.]
MTATLSDNTQRNARKKRGRKTRRAKSSAEQAQAKFPRHSLSKVLRIPRAILDQNAGRPSTETEVAAFVGVGLGGPLRVEISSALKFGLLERPETGKIQPSALAKKILRPQVPSDELDGYREAVLNAPEISDVYKHYRGENLPDDQFLQNTLVETYKIPAARFGEFKQVFMDSLEVAQLLDRHGDKIRVIDISTDAGSAPTPLQSDRMKKLGKSVSVSAAGTCFVMQPFAAPLGGYYEKIFKPAIEKAGLTSVRADAEIFGTGKIMDQVFQGIVVAKVLVAELTTRNPNVFYELASRMH